MEPRRLLGKQRLLGDCSPGRYSCQTFSQNQSATSTVTSYYFLKGHVKSRIPANSIRGSGGDWRSFGHHRCRHLKLSYKDETLQKHIRLRARGCQKMERPSDDSVITEVHTQSSSMDIVSKGQGTVQGAIALIIGTSVGAGILALPARTINVGFVPTIITMGISWCFLVLEALLLAEINVVLLEEEESGSFSRVLPLCAMAERTLGGFGGVLSAGIYCFLSYTVLVAYIAKSGEVLAPIVHTSPLCGCWIFALVLGGLTLLGKAKFVDAINQLLTTGMIGVFILIIVDGFGITDWRGLGHMNWEGAPGILPVVFFALVYHDLMPVLCLYLRGNIHLIRRAVLLGSAVPLAMFICWDAVILCVAPVSGGEDPLAYFTRLGGTSVGMVIQLFSVLALATSFIGTLIGFAEFFKTRWHEMLIVCRMQMKFITSEHSKADPSGPYSVHGGKDLKGSMTRRMQIASIIILLVPPLVASTMVSDAFFVATDLAGGYGMMALYGMFPPMMAWSLYERGAYSNKNRVHFMLARSKPQVLAVLAGSGICSMGIIFSQLFQDVHDLL